MNDPVYDFLISGGAIAELPAKVESVDPVAFPNDDFFTVAARTVLEKLRIDPPPSVYVQLYGEKTIH